MPAQPADRPVLDPDDIAGHAFTKARRGYEVDEVRAFLVALGSRVREARRQFDDMERRVAELERRAVDPKDLDEDAVTQLLGEETARVLDTARKAATEIRGKADEHAATTTDAADAQATETRQAADEYAADIRASVEQETTRVRTEADEYAAQVRASADADTTSQRAAADEYAAAVRSTADTEVSEFRAVATAEVERTRTEADTVLADRTADAEVSAGAVRADADAYHGRVREEADRYAQVTRAAADAYRADVQSSADAYRDAATAEGDGLRAAALADAETTRKGTDADAQARREATDREMESVLADAREQGRDMVQEARTYRERVIADLADRRRAARTQLEQLASTRDALAVTLTDVASRIESSHRLLQAAVIEPGEIGDLAQDRRTLEAGDQPATSVGVGEVDSPVETAEDDVTDVTDGDVTDGGGDDAAERVGSVDVDELAAESIEPDADSTADGDPAGADESIEQASVDDIFARLRADQEVATPEDADSADAEVTKIADEQTPAIEVQETEGEEVDAEEVGAVTADGDAGVVEEKGNDPDTDLLERRDATTDDLERQLARRLKRVLSDEQNEVLDLLRRTPGTPGAAEVLPSEADHMGRYTSAASEDLSAAERAGASFYGSAPRRAADVGDVASEFASELVRQIRVRLERAFEDGGDEHEVGERVRACYREWKTQRIADTARHYVLVAFSRGAAEAAGDTTTFRWLVDDGGTPCPDCDDNALAGPTATGEPFPTGDLYPPAHPGCRCLAVPLEVG